MVPVTMQPPRRLPLVIGTLFAAAAGLATWQVPSVAAGAVLHPSRRPVTAPRPTGCDDAVFRGNGVTLKGWRCRTAIERRGFIIFLHGVADNRAGVTGMFQRFTRRGLD